jgi:xanthomonalisin
MPDKKTTTLAAAFVLSFTGFAMEPARVELAGHVPPAVAGLVAKCRLPATNVLSLAIGLPLRNQDKLSGLLKQLYDPASRNFHEFLTPQEFTARFGPTAQDYDAVKQFAASNGLSVSGTYSNRVVLDVRGPVSAVEQAFHITLRTYPHPTEARDFYAPDTEPSVPVNVPVNDLLGLSDYARPRPMIHPASRAKASPLNYNGSAMDGSYQGADFRNAYVPGSSLTGSGQVVALFELDGYYPADITNYEAYCGYTNVPVQNVFVNNVSGTPGYSGVSGAVTEVSLDIELAIAMAPGLAEVLVYEGNNAYDVYNQIASDDIAKQVSSSWYFGYGPSHRWHSGSGTTLDSIFITMVAQGQALFQASGDSDAYTGSQAFNSSTGPIPMDSVYLTSVGGTSLTMNGTGASWNSETVWNYASSGGSDANVGSGGGSSANYGIPAWQTNVNMAANSGSTANRNIPDVALTADWVFVVHDNGSSNVEAGTSCAAPLWAGFCALANQFSTATNGTTLGFLNPALYAVGNSSVYSGSFHDITTGNNVGTHTAGLYNAVPGYDLATGWGTPAGTNLISALASPPPVFTSQPIGRNVTNGANVTLTAAAASLTPLAYFWQFNGTNLSAGGNISGTATNTLSITGATTNNSGSYQLVASNSTGLVISRPAVLNVGFAPAVSVAPASLTLLARSNAVFTATPGGSSPFGFQWKKNGTNFAGVGITGTNSSMLTLAGVTTNSTANYAVVVTNLFGSVTSSVASLTVVLPPAIASSSVTNRTIQCGSNNLTFAVAASGTPPLNYQWNFDGSPVLSATNSNFSVTNLHLPNHTVSVQITNAYGGLASNAVLTVQDTIPPVITLNGTNPIILELGSAYVDPGATATDLCMGAVSVMVSGSVNTNAAGTNFLVYTAGDGDGNTNTATRTVIVHDTTPPAILWSFTNLVLAANSNCAAAMPDVTGTNYILATDLSGLGNISQMPTNNFILPLGTNVVILAVADTFSNTAYSTNIIVVADETPPRISLQPQSQTNTAGTITSFSLAATACTPLAFQWYFNQTPLVAQTNSTLILSNVNPSAAGNYVVVASAEGGAVTSVVAVLTVCVPPEISGVTANPDGSYTLSLTGSPDDTYVLEAATNLLPPVNWVFLATNTLDTNGVWQFTDSQATNFTQQFYRLMLAP